MEINELARKDTWAPQARDPSQRKAIPLLWVFKYKFDTDGYLEKFKARVCVRGDLQDTHQDTYAATLAYRTFRALMALAAAFDLEIAQLDAVNAFLNSPINEETYVEYPEGFREPGKVLQLKKALYGLRQSPKLWYDHLTSTLKQLGLSLVPDASCLMTNEWLTALYYVDDILFIYHARNAHLFKALLI